MESNTADSMTVNLKQIVVLYLRLHILIGAHTQFFSLYRLLDKHHDRANISSVSTANLLILISINERTNTFIAENLSDKRLIHQAINEMDPWHSLLTSLNRMLRFGYLLCAESIGQRADLFPEVLGLNAANHLFLAVEAVMRRHENHLFRLELNPQSAGYVI